MALNEHDLSQLRASLQDAVVKCSERCLYQSAKWSAELLNSIPETSNTAQPTDYSIPAFSPNPDPEEARLEYLEFNRYILAKSFFDCREFDRCAAVFLPDTVLAGVAGPRRDDAPDATSPAKGKGKAGMHTQPTAAAAASAASMPRISQKSLFLALYAKYMSGEKRKDEESEMVMGPQDVGTVINKQLLTVSRFLSAWFKEREEETGEAVVSQGWLEYLYGMVLAKSKTNDQAMEYFIRSVHLFPMNWGCWLEMTSLIERVEDLNRMARHLPPNIISYIFHLHTSLELYQQGPSLSSSLDQLLGIFPTSAFLLTCNALLAYHSKDLIAAEQHFSRLLSLHPHRLDSLDHYSNILYVMDLRPKLAFIAHLCSSIDRFRPESCVVVGNYYSLLSMHEKAVQYFRRALTLDRSCLSAWTLMGHEYVELKNTHAAIESYRRAVDVNRRDYRAWYGLGQTYEVLEMHTYSLWYYKKAAGLRPWDAKMWVAVGSCLQRMGRDREGIKALKRALLADAYYDVGSSFGSGDILSGRGATGHMDPDTLFQIANMYNQMGDLDEAKSYMELCLAQEDGGAAEGGLGDSIAIHNDSPGNSDDEGDDGRGGGGRGGPSREGTGVTAATSKARMWLARYAMEAQDYTTANRLATELTQDGYDVEEAKALVRDARSRMHEEGAEGDSLLPE